MPKIVQFTHPGGEHGHDKGNPNHKSWNKRAHKRKFMLSKGSYVDNNELKEAELVFWGEWEPPSRVIKQQRFILNGCMHHIYPTKLFKIF